MFCNSCIKNKKLIKQKVRVMALKTIKKVRVMALEIIKKYVLWR